MTWAHYSVCVVVLVSYSPGRAEGWSDNLYQLYLPAISGHFWIAPHAFQFSMSATVCQCANASWLVQRRRLGYINLMENRQMNSKLEWEWIALSSQYSMQTDETNHWAYWRVFLKKKKIEEISFFLKRKATHLPTNAPKYKLNNTSSLYKWKTKQKTNKPTKNLQLAFQIRTN